MADPLGFVLPALGLGLNSVSIIPKRGFYKLGTNNPITRLPQVTLEEVHHDELEITQHPVEQGANIADHAFKRPAEVIVTYGWSNSPSDSGSSLGKQGVGLIASAAGSVGRTVIGAATTINSLLTGNNAESVKAVYEALLQLQIDRVPFDVFTGKRKYTDMLLKGLTVRTDAKFENAIYVVAHCTQVIIVSTSTISTGLINPDPAAQALPQKTTPPVEQARQQLQTVEDAVVTKARKFEEIIETPLPP